MELLQILAQSDFMKNNIVTVHSLREKLINWQAQSDFVKNNNVTNFVTVCSLREFTKYITVWIIKPNSLAYIA